MLAAAAAFNLTIIMAVLNLCAAIGPAHDAADIVLARYLAAHFEILDGSVLDTAKQPHIIVAGHLQARNGVPTAVKGSFIEGVVAFACVLADGRPFLVAIQSDVRRQLGAGGGGRYQTDGVADFFAVDHIPEQLQVVSIGDQKGRIRCAEAV